MLQKVKKKKKEMYLCFPYILLNQSLISLGKEKNAPVFDKVKYFIRNNSLGFFELA